MQVSSSSNQNPSSSSNPSPNPDSKKRSILESDSDENSPGTKRSKTTIDEICTSLFEISLDIMDYIENYFKPSDEIITSTSTSTLLFQKINRNITSFKKKYPMSRNFNNMEAYIYAIIDTIFITETSNRSVKARTSNTVLNSVRQKYQRCLSFAKNIDFFEQIITSPKGNIGNKGWIFIIIKLRRWLGIHQI